MNASSNNQAESVFNTILSSHNSLGDAEAHTSPDTHNPVTNPLHTFTFMGTGAGCGVPAFFCTCIACEEARTNPAARRGCCGVMIQGQQTTLIDTPPDLRHQLLRENVQSIDQLIYSHAHYDHLGGLGELEFMVHLSTQQTLPTYCSTEAGESLKHEYHYMINCLELHTVESFSPFEIDGVHYTPLPAAHAPGTFGYLLETPTTRLFYASDTARLPEETAQAIRGVDIAILDATYWKRNWTPQTHQSVQEAIDEGLNRLDVGTLYLTHLAMHYDEPITLAQLESYLTPYEGRVKVASDGLKLTI